MAIAIRGVTVGTYALGSSGTENKPSGTVSGDLLIACCYHTGTPTITGPTGWTRLLRVTGTSDVGWVADYWYKVAGGSEPASYTWSGGTDHLIDIASYSGVDNGTPFDVTVDSATSSSGVNIVAPSVTTATANAWISCGFWHYDSPALGVPAGMTALANADGLLVCDVLQAGAGASGTKTATGTSGIEKIAIITALRPASGMVVSDIIVQGVRLPYAILAQ